MSDMPLFDFSVYMPLKQRKQDVELKRVTGRLAESIELFFTALQTGETFHAEQLHEFVTNRLGKFQSPESATRVMRSMRQAGQINYELVNRRKSLYRKETVA